jgi:hypothetical protein
MVEAIFLDDYEREERDKRVAPNREALEAAIRDIAPGGSADVFLLADSDDVAEASRWLAVTASSGRYAVCAQLPRAVHGSISWATPTPKVRSSSPMAAKVAPGQDASWSKPMMRWLLRVTTS